MIANARPDNWAGVFVSRREDVRFTRRGRLVGSAGRGGKAGFLLAEPAGGRQGLGGRPRPPLSRPRGAATPREPARAAWECRLVVWPAPPLCSDPPRAG